MTRILRREEIERVLEGQDLLPCIEQAFADYSAGRCTIPPVGELLMERGEVHIKYGCIKGGASYVVKIASGFPGNVALGLASGNGVMLVFSQQTGALDAVLLDEGYLTDLRTAVAGAVAAKHLSPRDVERIGILGTGVQARMQAAALRQVSPCREIMLYGRSPDRRAACSADIRALGYGVEETDEPGRVAAACRLIVTTTSSHRPLLRASDVRAGTHINAMGSDTPEKQELDASVVAAASLVAVDSRAQALLRGEAHHALRTKAIEEASLVEIGEVILGRRAGRTREDEITVFDSTGLAVQDIAIASAVTGSL